MTDDSLSYDHILDRSIRLRETLLNKLVINGNINDKDDREFAIKLLDGIDRTILSNKKIKSDEKISENHQQNARAVVADILSNLAIKNNSNSNARELCVIDLPTDIIEGEMHIGIEDLSLDDIKED